MYSPAKRKGLTTLPGFPERFPNASNAYVAWLVPEVSVQVSQSIRSRNTLTKLREGRQKKAAEHRTYLLAGIVRCAYCGGPMWGGATSSNRGRRYRCRHIGVERCPQRMVTAEVVERQVLELLRWFDIPVSAHEDVAKAVISLCRATGGDDDYVRAETARRELALRRQRTLEMYRDGLCDKAFRDKSLADISEEEGRWDYATSTPGMSPSSPSNWFVASLPLFRSRARMPNGRSSSGSSRGSPSEMIRLSTWTYTRYTPRLSGGITTPSGLGGANTTGPSQIRLTHRRTKETG